MHNNQCRIGELAEKTGVTKRTIHYYMGRGLLPPPDGAGLGTTYSDEHLYRVLLIKKLQDEYLPLDEIKKRMAGMSLGDVRRSLEAGATQMKVQEQAGDYSVNESTFTNTHTNTDASAYENTHASAGVNSNVIAGAKAGMSTYASSNLNAGTRTVGIAGISYERLDVGFGLEIHFPAKNAKARELAEMLYRHAEKMMKEG